MDSIIWNIELTNRYKTLDPESDVAWFIRNFSKKFHFKDLDQQQIFNFITDYKTEIYFSGRGSDPILHPHFLNIVKGFKDKGSQIIINTHGVGRSREWWNELSSIIDKQDKIVFFFNKEKFKNREVMSALKSLCRFHKCKKTLQVDRDDKLFQKMKTKFKFDFYRVKEKHQQYKKPVCMPDGYPQYKLYIDCDGNFFPCAWIGGYRYAYSSVFNPKNKKFNIKNNTLKNILNDVQTKDFFQSIKDSENVHKCCIMKCKVKNG